MSLLLVTNPQKKSSTTNQQNKKKLVIMCYLLAGFNNKFISDIKEDIGFLLNASATSSLLWQMLDLQLERNCL